MAPYYPLTVARSDGEPTVPTKQGVKEPNQPTEEQMSDKPDVAGNVDCYKKLGIEDAKHIDWRRKLGGMMMHLLGGKAHAGMPGCDVTFGIAAYPDRPQLHIGGAPRRLCPVGAPQV